MLSPADQSLLAFLEGPPVCVLSGSEFEKKAVTDAPLYQRVVEWYHENGYDSVSSPSIGPVTLDKRAVTRSLRHGGRLNRAKTVGFAAVPKVLLHGHIIRTEPIHGSSAGCVYYVCAPITIVTEGFVVVVMVKKDQIKKGHWGARMYLHSVIAKAKLRLSAYRSGVDLPPEGQTHDPRSAEKAGVVWTLLSGLYAVNREGASRP